MLYGNDARRIMLETLSDPDNVLIPSKVMGLQYAESGDVSFGTGGGSVSFGVYIPANSIYLGGAYVINQAVITLGTTKTIDLGIAGDTDAFIDGATIATTDANVTMETVTTFRAKRITSAALVKGVLTGTASTGTLKAVVPYFVLPVSE